MVEVPAAISIVTALTTTTVLAIATIAPLAILDVADTVVVDVLILEGSIADRTAKADAPGATLVKALLVPRVNLAVTGQVTAGIVAQPLAILAKAMVMVVALARATLAVLIVPAVVLSLATTVARPNGTLANLGLSIDKALVDGALLAISILVAVPDVAADVAAAIVVEVPTVGSVGPIGSRKPRGSREARISLVTVAIEVVAQTIVVVVVVDVAVVSNAQDGATSAGNEDVGLRVKGTSQLDNLLRSQLLLAATTGVVEAAGQGEGQRAIGPAAITLAVRRGALAVTVAILKLAEVSDTLVLLALVLAVMLLVLLLLLDGAELGALAIEIGVPAGRRDDLAAILVQGVHTQAVDLHLVLGREAVPIAGALTMLMVVTAVIAILDGQRTSGNVTRQGHRMCLLQGYAGCSRGDNGQKRKEKKRTE